MKDRESSAHKMQESQEIKEDEKERSRGKRRTAREIAQMFEQLKQRHLTRKKEWQSEKQELLKQASVAEESRFLLVEMKCLLEELKNQLGSEEMKRLNVEDEYQKAKVDWKMEKERLLTLIANLESKCLGGVGYDYDRSVTDELDVLKSRLLARESDLAFVKKSNTDIQNSTQEMKRRFETEKQNILRNHDGEKKNWEKTRQVMLDKIETLQEELRNSRIDSFPLHGSHVGSPFDDAISALTSSPDMEDYYSTESKTPAAAAARMRTTSSNLSDSTDQSYGHFQRTVDEALHQIEKITQDLKQVTTNASDQTYSSVGPQNFKLSPHTSSSTTDNSQWVSTDATPLRQSKGSKLKIGDAQQLSLSSASTRSDNSKSSYASSSKLQKEDPKQPSDKFSCEKKLFSKFSQDSGKVSASPDVLFSPSESCSIPTFTESSTDSPQIPPITKPDEALTTLISSPTPETPEPISFTKIDKQYQKIAANNKKRNSSEGPSTKKLPSLHQQLLFGNASKPGTVPKDVPGDHETLIKDSQYDKRSPYVSTKTTTVSKAQRGKQRQVTKSNQQIVKPESGERSVKTKNIAKKSLPSAPDDFIDVSAPEMQTETDLVDKTSLDSIHGPPIRPKPSVTIEKDTRGNVLRVISDPRYSRQDSPRRTENLEDSQPRGRRRRSQDVVHDLKPLTTDKTSVTLGANRSDKTAVNHVKEIKQQGKESIGSKGKSWIKKRLSFLDGSQKEEETVSPKSNKKGDRQSSKTRSSSTRREGRRSILERSTSEESDDILQSSRKRPTKKEAGNKKGKSKRYTRSKTDSAVDVKNLLAKFKASQFSSKKPSIVKEFEKKLLENEVKALDEDKSRGKQSPSKRNESLRTTQMVREKRFEEDDGYRGEDELDYHSRRGRAKSKTLPATGITLARSPSIRSLQEQLFTSRDSPRRSFHRSMVNLSFSDEKSFESLPENDNSPTAQQTEKSQSLTNEMHPSKSIHIREEVETSRSNTTSSKSDNYNLKMDKVSQGEKASSNFLTMPEAKTGGRLGKKRLSWAINLQQSFEDGPDGAPPSSPRNINSSDRIATSAVSGILLKPKSSDHDLTVSAAKKTSASNKETSFVQASDTKNKGRLSQEMKKKAENLEKVLRKGSKTSKPRRYKRSDTQPIVWSPTTEESDSDCKPSQGMIRSQSMSSETFTKEFHDDLTPGLTSRFKKPTITNRRLPSRWKKKN